MHHVQTPSTVVSHVISPRSIDEALEYMARPNVRPIAGGTDLMVELDRGEHRELETLIDLSRVPGLDTIKNVDGAVTVGPLVTHNQCVASDVLRAAAPLLVQASWEVGSPQLRNRATIAGNVVTASPANDTLSALMALDATVTVASAARGERTIALHQFHLGVRKTALEPDELLTAIVFPALDDSWRSIYLKLGLRRAQAISVVHLAAMARFDGSVVTEARLALGSVAPTIVRVSAAEQLLVGKTLDDRLIAEAAATAQAAVTPIDDLRAPAEYRTAMVGEMTERALQALRLDGRPSAGAAPVLPPDPPLLWGQPVGEQPFGRSPSGPEFAADLDATSLISTTINGTAVEAQGAGLSLLDWLRDRSFTGVKEGCAEGECGSCTVDLDGMAVLSCLVPATRAAGATIVTIEGLAQNGQSNGDDLPPQLHPLQQAFIDTGAVQCGFCIPGFLMSGSKLLEEHPDPTEEQIKSGLSGNLCRCTGYYKIEDAVRVALLGDGSKA
ncbi:MAG: FAD binding domain-containing protein [Acidimicrobiales bacterium]